MICTFWATGTSHIALAAHLVMPQGHADDASLQDATHKLHEQFDIDHVTLQVMQQAFSQSCNQAAPPLQV